MTKAEWLAHVGPIVTPQEVAELADVALADARAVILAVTDRYHGTLPPPPWPAPPELVAQRKRVQAIRDGAGALVGRAPSVALLPAVAASLKREGAALYDRAAELAAASDRAPKLPDLLKLIPDPRRAFQALPVLLVVVGIYYLETRGQRFLEG